MSGFITHLSGQLIATFLPKIWLLQQGITYEISIPMSTFYELENQKNKQQIQNTHLYIHQIIREDTQELFGFATFTERELFRFLIKVSGIGSRTSLAVLSTFSVDELLDLIDAQNITGLTSIPGVGTKTAERLVLELKDKSLRLYFQTHYYFAQQQQIEALLHQKNSNLINVIGTETTQPRAISDSIISKPQQQSLISEGIEGDVISKNEYPQEEKKYHTKQELFQALQGLGYSEKDCSRIYVKVDKTLSLIDAIKASLRLLSKF